VATGYLWVFIQSCIQLSCVDFVEGLTRLRWWAAWCRRVMGVDFRVFLFCLVFCRLWYDIQAPMQAMCIFRYAHQAGWEESHINTSITSDIDGMVLGECRQASIRYSAVPALWPHLARQSNVAVESRCYTTSIADDDDECRAVTIDSLSVSLISFAFSSSLTVTVRCWR